MVFGGVDVAGRSIHEPSVADARGGSGEVGLRAEEGDCRGCLHEGLAERAHDLGGGVGEAVEHAHEAGADVGRARGSRLDVLLADHSTCGGLDLAEVAI